jgi:hypothetical protein
MPSDAAMTTEAGTQSLQPGEAKGDRTFAKARTNAVPLIRKAMDELDKVDNTSTPGSNLRHVAKAMDLVQQAGFIFDGVDDEIARHFYIAADHIDAANELLGLPINT